MNIKDTIAIKENILKTSIDVFRRNGYAKVSMEDIAKELGMGRSSLYYYYKNKFEVFKAAALNEFVEVLAISQTGISEKNTILGNLSMYNHKRVELLEEMTNKFESLVNDIKNNPTLMSSLDEISVLEEQKIITQIFEWGIENKEIKPLDADELYYLSKLVSQAISSMARDVLLFKMVDNLTKRLDWLSKIILKGLT